MLHAAVLSLPLLVAWQAWVGQRERVLLLTIAAVLAAAGLAVSIARPAVALTAVVVVLPVQVVLLAGVLQLGAPVPLVRNLGNVKELVLLGAIAAVLLGRGHRAPLDLVDRLALGFVALASAYLVAMLVLGPAIGPVFPLAPRSSDALLRSYRTNVGFVLVMLTARRLRWSVQPSTLGAVVVGLGALVGAAGVVEYLATDLWRQLTRDLLDVPAYVARVLGSTDRGGVVTQPVVAGADETIVRVGSLLFSPLVVGFYLCVPLGVALLRFVRRPTAWAALAMAAMAATIAFTSTRSAAMAAAVVVLGALTTLPTTWLRERGRATLVAVVGVTGGLVVAATTGLGTRFLRALTGDDASADGHREAMVEGTLSMLRHPFGLGLGTGPTVSARFSEGTRVVSENAYLQVGNELGIPGFLVFTALVVVVVVTLFRLARRPDADDLDRGVAAAGFGLAVGALFLHVWTDLPTAWTFWLLAGFALRHGRDAIDGAGPA